MRQVLIACNKLARAQIASCRVNQLQRASDILSEPLKPRKPIIPNGNHPALVCHSILKLISLLSFLCRCPAFMPSGCHDTVLHIESTAVRKGD
jgi:hypothetical protein